MYVRGQVILQTCQKIRSARIECVDITALTPLTAFLCATRCIMHFASQCGLAGYNLIYRQARSQGGKGGTSPR